MDIVSQWTQAANETHRYLAIWHLWGLPCNHHCGWAQRADLNVFRSTLSFWNTNSRGREGYLIRLTVCEEFYFIELTFAYNNHRHMIVTVNIGNALKEWQGALKVWTSGFVLLLKRPKLTYRFLRLCKSQARKEVLVQNCWQPPRRTRIRCRGSVLGCRRTLC